MIEKVLERLEELYDRNDRQKKTAYEEQAWEEFDLFMHRNEGVYLATKIVQEVAKEYEKRNCHNCQYETTPGDCEPCCFCKNAYGDDCFKPKDAPYQKGE